MEDQQQPGEHFLYVGRLSEEKGIMLLLSAFSLCPYKLKIAGDGLLKVEVVLYSSKYPNIEFFETLNKAEVFSLPRACTALVFPSFWSEGMPLTIIKAFACGTPVISSKIGVMETMIVPGYDGLHFKPKNGEDFKKNLDKWNYLSENRKKEYRLNCRKTYEACYAQDKNLKQL